MEWLVYHNARERFARTGGHHVAKFHAGHHRHVKIAAEAKTSLFALDVFVPHPSESCNRGTHRAERIGSDFLRGQAPGRFDGALLHCQIIRMVHRC